MSYCTCVVKQVLNNPSVIFLPSTVIVKTPGEDMLLRERSHLTSPSEPQQGILGSPNGGTQRGWGGGDAAAVSADDASAVSARTRLDGRPRTLRFQDMEAERGAPLGQEAAAERRIRNMFPSKKKKPMLTRSRLEQHRGEGLLRVTKHGL